MRGAAPDAPLASVPGLIELLRRARVGRAGGVILVDRQDRVAWDLDDDQVKTLTKESYPELATLMAGARWLKHPALPGGGLMRDNGVAETALSGSEFWVITPVAGGRFTLASHGELDGRNAAALAKAQATLDGVLGEITVADQRVIGRLKWALAGVLALGTLLMLGLAAGFRARIVAPIRHLAAG